MASIETVVFDLDGVLSRYDFPRRLEVLAAGSGLTPAEIEARIFTSGFDERADEGAYTADEYMAEFARRLGRPVSTEQWLEARAAGMTEDLEMLELVRAVGRRAGVAMLTNNGPVLQQHFARVAPRIAETFGERALFSCAFGAGKSGTRVFDLLLAEIGAGADTTLFVDDTPEYIENAREAGLSTHLFTGIDRLRAELVAHGLL